MIIDSSSLTYDVSGMDVRPQTTVYHFVTLHFECFYSSTKIAESKQIMASFLAT